MQSKKAYILKIDTPISNEYAKVCADSCDKVGLDWEYSEGFSNMTAKAALGQLNIPNLPSEPYQYIDNPPTSHKAFMCTAGHFRIWQKIAKGKEDIGVVLEHDAFMFHNFAVHIPDDRIVVLGYKLENIKRYDNEKAGSPKELIDIDGHEGAHAYAMTRKTAQMLLEELANNGIRSAIDNDYFIRKQRKTAIPLSIMSPTPAIGWLRQSTIWAKSAARNYEFIPSFQQNYK